MTTEFSRLEVIDDLETIRMVSTKASMECVDEKMGDEKVVVGNNSRYMFQGILQKDRQCVEGETLRVLGRAS